MTSDHRRSGGEQLSDRDRAILGVAGSFRLISAGQLQRLFFTETQSSAATAARLTRRSLQRLTALNLLLRMERRLGGVRAGSSSWTYALSPAGGRVIAAPIGRGRTREPSLTFARHTLAVAEVAVALHEAKRAGRLDSLRIETEPACWRSLDGYDDARLKPDLFVLAGVGDLEQLAWIEVDLGSESGPALMRKAGTYERYYRSGREQAKLGAFPRVLWLAHSAPRRSFMERVLVQGPGSQLTRELHRVRLLSDPIGALLDPD